MVHTNFIIPYVNDDNNNDIVIIINVYMTRLYLIKKYYYSIHIYTDIIITMMT